MKAWIRQTFMREPIWKPNAGLWRKWTLLCGPTSHHDGDEKSNCWRGSTHFKGASKMSYRRNDDHGAIHKTPPPRGCGDRSHVRSAHAQPGTADSDPADNDSGR